MEEQDFSNFRQFLRIKGYSRRTVEAYLYYNKNFLKLANKSPRKVTKNDISNYLNYLALRLNSAASTLNLAYSALKCYYGSQYRRKFFIELPRARKNKKLPAVLSRQEIMEMIALTRNAKHHTILSLLYGCGLRVSEVVNIRMNDISLERKMLKVNQGKGNKDRYVPIPEKLIAVLMIQGILKSGEDYLFTGGGDRRKLTTMSVSLIVKDAAARAGIKHGVSPHTLRHSFATHLLENGIDIRYIQALLGHARLETTQIYTKVTDNKLSGIMSPLDYE